MRLRVDRDYPMPLQQQLTEQIRQLIELGELLPGDPLPTIRDAAGELQINPNTVAAAYRQLEQEGYLRQRKRAGTTVAEAPPRRPEALAAALLAARSTERAAASGISHEELLRAVAAHGLGRGTAEPRMRVAVLAASELQAQQLAARTEAILGERVECEPLTPERYHSVDFHLTVIDPGLSRRLVAPQPRERPLPTYLSYGPEFPAGAD